jgi:GrpB-like predicted nucleotidyltransferase (UPF0157 family)
MTPLIVPHDPHWKDIFLQEQAALQAALAEHARVIHHIGSTSIPNILAKPIIDILIEADSLDSIDNHTQDMQSLSYEPMGEFGIPTRRYFRKSNPQSIRTHHVHIFETGSPHLHRHLAFRDYLLAHPSVAQDYSQLKASITKSNTSPEHYITAKDPFIKQTEQAALTWSTSNH